MELHTIVHNALGQKQVDVQYPGYLESVLSAMNDTRVKINRIVPVNRERVLYDLALLSRENLDTAIQTTSTLILELVNDYNQKYVFGYDLDDIEDNDYIVRLKKLLNSMLVFKTHRLFNKGLRDEAENIKKEQMSYLNRSRYDGWREDMEKWAQVEFTWAKKIEEEQSKTQVGGIDIFYQSPETPLPPKYVMNDKNLKENFDHNVIFKAYLDLGQYETALLYAIERIEFFLTPSVKEFQEIPMQDIYNPLVLVNAPFIKEWSDNILLVQQLTDELSGKNKLKMIDAIQHILNLDAKYGQVPGNVKTLLSNILFQLDDTL